MVALDCALYSLSNLDLAIVEHTLRMPISLKNMTIFSPPTYLFQNNRAILYGFLNQGAIAMDYLRTAVYESNNINTTPLQNLVILMWRTGSLKDACELWLAHRFRDSFHEPELLVAPVPSTVYQKLLSNSQAEYYSRSSVQGALDIATLRFRLNNPL